MSLQERQLAIECRQASETLGRLIETLNAEPAAGAVERGPMIGELGRCLRRMNRLATAALRPPALGIFGPPRSGKSTLARMLATDGGPREAVGVLLDPSLPLVDLAAHLTPRHPASAGIVVRLGSKPPAAPPLFPFPTQLLAAADIVKILARAYYSAPRSASDPMPDAASIHAIAVDAGRALRLFPVRGLEADEVADIREYLEHNFYSDPRVRALAAAGYWEHLDGLVSHLPDEARADLLAPLWGSRPAFRALFLSLAGALEALAHSGEVFCPIEAYIDIDPATRRIRARADSIAATDTALAKVSSDEQVMVRTKLGHFAGVGRGELAALASEVRLSVSGDTGALIEDAQILDFPALEPRALAGRSRGNPGSAEIARQFRRAKREYLHETYVRNHELTAVLVCFDPAATSVDPLAAHVGDWVDLAQGRDPAIREQSGSALFVAAMRTEAGGKNAVALTKDDPWLARLGTSLADRFGRLHGWPREWAPGRQFENVFLLRATAIADNEPLALIEEAGSNERRLALLEPDADSARARFLANDTVRRYVRDPAQSWRESQVGPDGGVAYLAEQIAAVCDGLARQRQTALALRDIRARLREALLRNVAQLESSRMLDWRLRDAQVVVSRQRQAAEGRRFGALLEALQVPETELREVLHHLELTPREPSKSTADPSPPILTSVHAAAAIDYWLDRMRTLLVSREAEATLGIARRVLGHVVEELSIAVRRLDLVGVLASRLGWAVSDRMSADERIGRSALLASGLIASFVTGLCLEDQVGRRSPRLLTDARAASQRSREAARTPAADHAWRLAFVALVRDNAVMSVPRGDGDRSEVVRDLLTSLGIGGVWEYGP